MAASDLYRANAEAQRNSTMPEMPELFPGLCMEQKSRYECGDSICIIKWILTATHEGEYLGIPPSIARLHFPPARFSLSVPTGSSARKSSTSTP